MGVLVSTTKAVPSWHRKRSDVEEEKVHGDEARHGASAEARCKRRRFRQQPQGSIPAQSKVTFVS
jgi:hypothetical protein